MKRSKALALIGLALGAVVVPLAHHFKKPPSVSQKSDTTSQEINREVRNGLISTVIGIALPLIWALIGGVMKVLLTWCGLHVNQIIMIGGLLIGVGLFNLFLWIIILLLKK